MSHDPNLAIALPGQPLIFIAPAVLVVLLAVVFVVLRKSRAKRKTVAAWAGAADELGLELAAGDSKLGPVARGRVNNHIVTVAPATMGTGRAARLHTVYSVKFEAPEAPKFALRKRVSANRPVVDTGNPKFDAVVEVDTDNAPLLSRYLTAPRRAAILRLLMHWPDSTIGNREAHLATIEIEQDQLDIVDAVCHLVAAAETFDRPTRRSPVVVDGMTGVAAGIQSHGDQLATADASAAGEGDVLTEIRLDEMTVIEDLFDTGLSTEQTAVRFAQIYQGRQVTWSGEVVRSSPIDDGARAQRIAALIGSADGQDPRSGRVVAITTVGPEPVLEPGDVVTFSGELANLVAERRLFQLI